MHVHSIHITKQKRDWKEASGRRRAEKRTVWVVNMVKIHDRLEKNCPLQPSTIYSEYIKKKKWGCI